MERSEASFPHLPLKMKAALYHKFGGSIVVEDVNMPSVHPDGIIIQLKAAGVCRSDWHGWKGHDGDVKAHGLPFCPGHELSGVVVDKGPDVKTLNSGDRVVVPFILSCGDCHYCSTNHSTVCQHQQQPGFTQWGGFAEYVSIPRADRNVSILPDAVSFLQAAALGCRFTTAYRAVIQRGNIQEGQSIGIFGCGGVGLSCVMLAQAYKAKSIIAVDVSQNALDKAKALGATHTFLLKIGDDEQLENTRKELRSIASSTGDGVDVSIDAAGFASTCENAIHCTRRGGRMIQVGLPVSSPLPVVPCGLIAGWELDILGSHGFAPEDLPVLLNMVATQQVNPELLVEAQVSLSEGARALEEMDKGSPLGITLITDFTK